MRGHVPRQASARANPVVGPAVGPFRAWSLRPSSSLTRWRISSPAARRSPLRLSAFPDYFVPIYPSHLEIVNSPQPSTCAAVAPSSSSPSRRYTARGSCGAAPRPTNAGRCRSPGSSPTSWPNTSRASSRTTWSSPASATASRYGSAPSGPRSARRRGRSAYPTCTRTSSDTPQPASQSPPAPTSRSSSRCSATARRP